MKELSVVMGAYQRGYAIDWALFSFMKHEVLPDEIIIVDDGSTDDTERKVLRIQKWYPELNIKYYYTHNPKYTTGAYALNCAIRKATKEIIMLTFAEVLHPTPNVEVIKRHFEDPKNERSFIHGKELYWTYGTEYNKKLRNLYYSNDMMEMIKREDVYTWVPSYISPDDTITYFPMGCEQHAAGILRKHLIEVGGFDEEFARHGICGNEDIDLWIRLGTYCFDLRPYRTSEIVAIHLGHERQEGDKAPSKKEKGALDKYRRRLIHRSNETLDEYKKRISDTKAYVANKDREWGKIIPKEGENER